MGGGGFMLNLLSFAYSFIPALKKSISLTILTNACNLVHSLHEECCRLCTK